MRKLLLFLAFGLVVGFSSAQEKSVRPGINKDFENPDVKDFLGKFEVESREVYAQRKEIVEACKIKPGMVVADIGAGTGLFTRMFAKEVGDKGKVYAVDIAPKFIEHIEKTCKEAGIKNVTGVVGTADNVKLPPKSIDLAFICDTYHHFEFPFKTMASIHEALRPGGQVVVIDFHRIEGKSREWVLGHVRAGQEVVLKEIKQSGFKLVGEEKLPLKENYFVRFEKVEAAQEKRPPISPSISFSKDEQTVTVKYDKGEWTCVRPVVSSWDYKAVGKVWWVDVKGDDANRGNAEKPLKTIGKAVAQAEASDVIYVRAGTYVENLVVKKSGEEGKPIILSCAPDALGKVKITPSKEYVEKNPSGAVVTLQGAQHFWINGFVIEGPLGRPEAPAMETFGANGITWAGKAGLGCRATNNVVYGNVHCGMKEMGHGGTKILMEANVIFENGTESRDHGIYCPSDDLTINGNIIFNNAGYGIHSYSQPKRQVISRNVCIGNKVCGIILAGSDCKVFHNVCVGNGVGIFYYRGGCKGNVVKNNIFAFNKTDCGYDNGSGKYGDPADNSDDYNCYFPGKPAEQIKPGTHEILADPQFIDAKKGDYRLKHDSPCRGKGVDVGLPFKGKALDLGAFAASEEKAKPIPVKVIVDIAEVPELVAWAGDAKRLVETWHPKLADLLTSDDFTAPAEVKLVFKKDMKGVASTSGATISIAAAWVKQHPDDYGMVVHELTHVVQAYPRPQPGWLVEGIADYVRYYHFEPKAKLAGIDPSRQSYRDGYGVTAMFLAWIDKTHDKTIVPKLNAALRKSEYHYDFFKKNTGKSLDRLWADFLEEEAARGR
jgi:ubiquinone/menaquinone biosynthesis C-methylase UbiE